MGTDETRILEARAKAAKLAKGNSSNLRSLRSLRATINSIENQLRQKNVATRFWKGGRLIIMLGGQKGFWRRKRRGILIASSIVTLFIAFLLLYEPSSPDGTYYWPELACGHGVWIFRDGKIYDQCVGDDDPTEVGAYIKSGNKWISFGKGGNGKDGIVIKPSIFGIKFYGFSSKKSCNFYFRDQFSWVIDCKAWFQRHF